MIVCPDDKEGSFGTTRAFGRTVRDMMAFVATMHADGQHILVGPKELGSGGAGEASLGYGA